MTSIRSSVAAPPGRRLRAIVAGLLLTALVVPAPATAADDDTQLRVGITGKGWQGGVGDLNVWSAWPWWPATLTWELLVGLDDNAQPFPWFAESWSASDDKQTWTFKIPADKVWSDGTPATARDVVFSYELLKDSIGTDHELNLGWQNTSLMSGVLDSVTAVDDQTVEMKLTRPSNYPLRDQVFIIPEHVFGDVDPAKLLDGTYEFALPTVGTGPFRTVSAKQGEQMVLEPNPRWAGQAPGVSSIVFSRFDTQDAAALALANGEIDIADGVPNATWSTLDEDASIVGERVPTGWVYYLGYNTLGTKAGAATDATADPAFRDALGYAIDREELIAKALLGNGILGKTSLAPTYALTFQAIEDDLAPIARTYDPDEAARRLDAAGYRDSDGDGVREDKAGKPLELRLYTASDYQPPNVAPFIVDYLGAVGVRVTPTSMDSPALREHFKLPADGGGNWDLAIGDWWQFEVAAFDPWLSSQIGVANMTFYSNPEVDRLASEYSSSTDPDAARDLAVQISRIAYTDLPGDILFFNPILDAHRIDRFTGWPEAPKLSYGVAVPEPMWTSLVPMGARRPSGCASDSD